MRRFAALLALALTLPATAVAAPPRTLSNALQRVAAPATAPATRGAAVASDDLLRSREGYVTDIRTRETGDALVHRLRAAGARVELVSHRYDTVTAAVAPEDLAAVAAVNGVKAVNAVRQPQVGRVGDGGASGRRRAAACPSGIVSEGDTQLKAALARASYGVDGGGVKVGILSDSFDTKKGTASPPPTTAADDIASGDLPGPGNPCGYTTPVNVLADYTPPAGQNTGDEGRAMAQIVHDIAPGAQLLYATAFVSETQYAANIVALKNAGADIIVDDVINSAEPMYQDGPVANAVRQVTDAGVAYFSMAFNNGQRVGGADVGSWEAPGYRSTACPAAVSGNANFPAGSTCMDFDPATSAVDPTFDMNIATSGTTCCRLNAVLQWAQPRGGVTADYDLWILYDGAVVTGVYSLEDNLTTQLPFESAGIQGGSAQLDRQIVISRRPGGGDSRLKFEIFNNGYPITSFEYPTGGGVDTVGPTIFGHNGTASAQTVGAISVQSSTAPEDFSGRGPVTHLFGPVAGAAPAAALATPEILSKPDVTASDRGANSFFGSLDGSVHRFSGTSAAAPHAAAVAALQLQEDPDLSAEQLKANQRQSATPIGAFGPLAIGSGLVTAPGAIAADPLTLTATGPVALGTNRQPTTSFSANHRSATFTCVVDGGATAACGSPFTPAPLPDGAHTVAVTAKDGGGATTTQTVAFAVDATGPDTQIGSGPPASTTQTAAAFTYAGSPAGDAARFECSLDAAAFTACPASGQAYGGLAIGAHSFAVRAADALGNLDATPATSAWTVTKPPATPAKTKRCAVPKLKGKTRAKAKRALKKAGCTLGKVKGRRGGVVTSQSPKAGKSTPKGTKVSVKLKRRR